MTEPWLTSQRLFIFIGLLLLVALSWWLRNSSIETVTTAEVLPGQPDYYMTGLKVRTLGEDGKLRHHMSAQSMAHFPQDDTTRLERPQVIIYRAEQPAWVIEAQQGVMDNQAQTLSLLNGVQLTQGQRAEKSAMNLKTEVLHISLVDEVATTEERVYALQEGVGHAEGTGMTLDLKKDRLELHARVQFTYENP